jgi:hypothetical protein
LTVAGASDATCLASLEAGDQILPVQVLLSIIHHVRDDYDRSAAGAWSSRNQIVN